MTKVGRASGQRLADLPLSGRVFVVGTIAIGAALFPLFPPDLASRPIVFLVLLAVSLLTAVFKVDLPLSRGSATMTLAYAPDFACLLLLGPNEAMVIAAASVWCQCTFRTRAKWPLHRTLFSIASIAISIQIVGLVFRFFGGTAGFLAVSAVLGLVMAASTAYFLANTWFVATAVALSTRVPVAKLWREDFLWSAPSYFLAAGVAVPAAVAVEAEIYWALPLAITPLYLTYRSYKIYLGRVESEQAHARELAAEKVRLAVERERLAVTLRNIGDCVITTDVAATIVLMNKAAEDLLGATQHQAEGCSLLEALEPVFATAGDLRQAMEHVLDHGMRVQLPERSAFTAALRGRTFEGSGSPIRNSDATVAGGVWVFRDVTDTIRLEQERSKAVRLESLGVLAGGLAHDFNNILTGVLGNLSLARLEACESEEISRRLAQAERACHRARGITSQLLTFSRGGAPIKTPASIRGLVEDTATFALRGSKVALRLTVQEDLWPAAVDVGQISQVISNLVINAQQAMPSGGVLRIEMRNVELGFDEFREGVHIPAGRFVSTAVSDDGAGIPKEHLHRIYDPYFTTKQMGSGLGLATTYSIVTAHNGYITVESTVGIGTRFVIYLPASDAAPSAALEHGTEREAVQGGRALIMDDEQTIREVAAAMLETLGYETVTAKDGADAIVRFREALQEGRPFDVVVVDLTIPGGMGGQAAIAHLKALDPHVRAIASSGYTDDPIAVNCEEWGFRGMLAKPFDMEDVRQALARARSEGHASRRASAE